ncbi:MAG: RHS repeat protein [Anaerolineae bacterium]|nr:RHS repeat protein [Anaerolineae bacterium]
MEKNENTQSSSLEGLIAEHHANPKAQSEALLVGWCFIITGAFLALVGMQVSKGEWPELLIAAVGLPLAIIGVVVLIGRQRRHDLCVRIFTDGFTRTMAGQMDVIRWDEVAEIWQNVTQTYRGNVRTNTTHIYTVRLTDGRKFVFNGQMDKIAALGSALQQQCASGMLPRAREAYQAGESLVFGPFSVNRAGIAKGRATLPWEQVEQVELRQGVLHIRKKGERRDWAFAMASKIPNLPVLMALVNQRYLR